MRKLIRSQTAKRLKRLETELDRVARKQKNADAIHDLRVSIRRLRQELNVFEPWFGSETTKKVRQPLRRLMKGCGEVRNCDIAIEVLRAAKFADKGVVGSLNQQRQRKRQELAEEIEVWRKKDRIGKWRDRLKAAQGSSREIADKAAARLLPPMVDDLFRAGRTAAHPGSSLHNMHRVRLKAKQVRYTVDLFSQVYGKRILRIVDSLKGLQDKLGAINDCATTLEMIRENRAAAAAVRRLIRERQAEFRAYWKSAFNRRERVEWVAVLKAADRKK